MNPNDFELKNQKYNHLVLLFNFFCLNKKKYNNKDKLLTTTRTFLSVSSV